MIKDPEITVAAALDLFDGNQSRLAHVLGINRSSVCQWVTAGRKLVPTVHAYRLREIFPERFGDAA